jgi:DNA mismatch repair ATPase MutS
MQINYKGEAPSFKIENNFIKINKTKTSITFTTETLTNLNDRINELTQKIFSMSNM